MTTRALPASIDEAASLLGEAGYVCGRSLATVVFLSLKLGRPLFLEGEAGVGKTEIAKALAEALGRRLIRLQCYEGLDAASAVYEWNFAAQMIEIRLAEAAGDKDREALGSELFSERFLTARPLLEAMRPQIGGPPVQVPSRRGFGSSIIERSIPHELGGHASLNWRVQGLEARFVLPPTIYTRGADPEAASRGREPQVRTESALSALSGISALLVEDNMIMALDAEQILLENGLASVHTAMSLSDAHRIVDNETLEVALLDVNLGRETSFSLIGPLNERNIPYVFVTGYGEELELPATVRPGTQTIKKPYVGKDMLAALVTALQLNEIAAS